MRRLALFLVLLAFGLTFASDPPRTKLTGVEVTRSLVLPDCDDAYGSKEPGELCRVPSTGEVRRWDGSSWVAIGGSEGTEDITYTVENASGTYRVRNADGSVVYSSSDAGAAIDYAIDHCSPSGGTVVLRSGDTFTYSSTIPTFEPNNSGWVRVLGYGTKIILTDSAVSAFRFHRNAPGDTFQWIWIEGLNVDGSAIVHSNAGVLLTNYLASGSNDPTQVSFEHIRVYNVHVYGLYAGPDYTTTHIGSIRLRARDDSEVYNPHFDDIEIVGLYQRGGHYAANFQASVASHVDAAYGGRIVVRNSYADMRPLDGSDNVQEQFFPSTCFHVGGYGEYDEIVYDNLTCYAPGDNCYEVNNGHIMHLSNLTCWNPHNVGITLANHIVMDHPERQLISVENYNQRVTDVPDDAGGVPVMVGIGGGHDADVQHNPVGTVVLSDMSYLVSLEESIHTDASVSAFVNLNDDSAIKKVSIDGISAYIDLGEVSLTSNSTDVGINIKPYPWDWDGDSTDESTEVVVSNVNSWIRMWEGSGSSGVLYHPFNVARPARIRADNCHFYVDTGSGSLYRADLVYVGAKVMDGPYSFHMSDVTLEYDGEFSGLVRTITFSDANVDLEEALFDNVWAEGGNSSIPDAYKTKLRWVGFEGGAGHTGTFQFLGMDDEGPIASDYKDSGNGVIAKAFTIGNRSQQDFTFFKDLDGNWTLGMHVDLQTEWDGANWTQKWVVPSGWTGNRWISRLSFGNSSQIQYLVSPYQSRAAGDEVTDWQVIFYGGMKDFDGDGVLDDQTFCLHSAATDLCDEATLAALAPTDYDYIAKFNATNTNVRVGVHQDGDLGIDGELQLGAAEKGSEADAFCQYRLSNDTILLDADCDKVQDSDEVCLAAGGRDPDCDGTAEWMEKTEWYKSNMSPSQNYWNTVADAARGKTCQQAVRPATIRELRCYLTEDLNAGTVTVEVRVYDTCSGSLDHTTGLSVVIDDTIPAAQMVTDSTCTDCTVDAGDYIKVVYSTSSDYEDDGADNTADLVCITIFDMDVP